MSFVKRLVKAERGFTLVEMTVVIAIIAVLAALALPAVTGVTTDTRGTSKTGDQKEVEQAVSRFEDANPSTLPSKDFLLDADDGVTVSQPATTAVDSSGDGNIDFLVINTSGTLIGTNTPTVDVTCSSGTLDSALLQCLVPINFQDLVPDFMTSSPKHAKGTSSETIFETGSKTATSGTGAADSDQSTADFTIKNCDLSGNTCRFFMATSDGDLNTALEVWQLNANGGVFTLKEDAQYGKK